MELFTEKYEWKDRFFEELAQTKELRIISPFVQERILREMLFDFNNLEIITRFSLEDFAHNISSLDGLQFAVEKGASVFGVKDLHSKTFLFDERAAVITSANLTNGGLRNNHECGIYITDIHIIQKLHDYFKEFKCKQKKLSIQQCEEWQKQILPRYKEISKIKDSTNSLCDYGAEIGNIKKHKPSIPRGTSTSNYYVKFCGTSNTREPLTYTTKESIETSLCHYACGFSQKKKPTRFKDGDIIYMARMIKKPNDNDYAIFGRAEAIKFVESRDAATAKEKRERDFKETWPIYLRVENPVFIDGTMNDCVLLYELIKEFGYNSFASTKSRHEKGEKGINPYKSLCQQPYIHLTEKAAEWLESRFQEVLNKTGKVDDDFIDSLPKSEIDIKSWKQ